MTKLYFNFNIGDKVIVTENPHYKKTHKVKIQSRFFNFFVPPKCIHIKHVTAKVCPIHNK